MIEIGKWYLHENSLIVKATCFHPDTDKVRFTDRFGGIGEVDATELKPWEPKTEPKPRLFVRAPWTDDQWWHCGGPDVGEATNGLKNMLRIGVEDLLSPGEPDYEDGEIELEVFQMTDEEVAILPDL